MSVPAGACLLAWPSRTGSQACKLGERISEYLSMVYIPPTAAVSAIAAGALSEPRSAADAASGALMPPHTGKELVRHVDEQILWLSLSLHVQFSMEDCSKSRLAESASELSLLSLLSSMRPGSDSLLSSLLPRTELS